MPVVTFTALIKKFEKKGEKTGWTFVEINAKEASRINPGAKVSYRIKGTLDGHPIKATAIIPMGKGNFILPLKAELRKRIGKEKGSKLTLAVELDSKPLQLDRDLIACLKAEPAAFAFFDAMPRSHQNYYSKWIEGAKTIGTKSKRITMAVIAMSKKLKYNEMLRAYRDDALM